MPKPSQINKTDHSIVSNLISNQSQSTILAYTDVNYYTECFINTLNYIIQLELISTKMSSKVMKIKPSVPTKLIKTISNLLHLTIKYITNDKLKKIF